MEPKLPSPDRGPEFRPNAPVSNEESLVFTPEQEIAIGGPIERAEQRNEMVPVDSGAISSSSITLPLPVPIPVQSDASSVTQSASDDDLPDVAGDSELIEKEWVHKAKKVIADTKDDPYRREQEVNKLQADYLLKRYGRKLGSPQ